MTSIRFAASIACVALVALTATGCSAAARLATAGASASPAASPDLPDEPTARFPLTCDGLVSSTDLRALFADRTARVDPQTVDPGGSDGIPASDFVRTAGGLACAWANSKTDDGSATRSAESATLSILPTARAGWKRYRTDYGVKSDRQAYCSGDATITSCYLNAYVGGYWIEADFENIDARLNADSSPVIAPAKSVFSHVLASVAALGPARPRWTPPPATIPIPRTCDGYISPKQLEDALGIRAKIQLVGPESGAWGLDAQAQQDAAGIGCLFSAGSADDGYGDLAWLPGGSWAAAADPASASSHALTVPGLVKGDSATWYASTESGGVYVNLVLGGNWVQFDLWPNSTGGALPATTVPISTSLTRIASDIVANVHG